MLLASEFPFRRVIGIEFAPELHAVAERNIPKYGHGPNGCREVESVCMDFFDFVLPPEPLVLFLFDPCTDVVFPRILERIRDSLRAHPRPLYLIYVAPGNMGRRECPPTPFARAGSDRWSPATDSSGPGPAIPITPPRTTDFDGNSPGGPCRP